MESYLITQLMEVCIENRSASQTCPSNHIIRNPHTEPEISLGIAKTAHVVFPASVEIHVFVYSSLENLQPNSNNDGSF